MPALAQSTSMLPKALATSAKAAVRDASSVTSPATAMAPLPSSAAVAAPSSL